MEKSGAYEVTCDDCGGKFYDQSRIAISTSYGEQMALKKYVSSLKNEYGSIFLQFWRFVKINQSYDWQNIIGLMIA